SPENSSGGESLQEDLRQPCAVVGGDAECPGRVPGVPALVRLHHVEEGPTATADRFSRHSCDSEGRSVATGGECRHTLISFPLSPDPDAVSAAGDVSFQPWMMDAALSPQPFDDCSNPC